MGIISEISDLDLPWACRTEEASSAPLAKNEVGKTGLKDIRDRDREIEEERRGKEKRGGEGGEEEKRRERRRGERNEQAFFPKGFPINFSYLLMGFPDPALPLGQTNL